MNCTASIDRITQRARAIGFCFGIATAFFGLRETGAFTGTDADNVFNSYNNSFYVSSAGLGYYKADTGGGRADFGSRPRRSR